MVATMPRASTSRRRSGTDQRASGTPTSIARSQAIRSTSTTTLGGKAGRTPAPRLRLEARDAVAVEALRKRDGQLARPRVVVAVFRRRS